MTNKFVEGYPSVEQEREVGLDRAIAEKLQEPEETQWKGDNMLIGWPKRMMQEKKMLLI